MTARRLFRRPRTAASPLRIVVALAALLLAVLPASAQEPVFMTDALNPGLPDPPADLDRSTPMGSMEAFLHLTDRGRFQEAAHLLDLTGFPLEDQPAFGAVLAERLAVILDRKVIIPWFALADRPDGWLTGSQNNDQTGRVRRSIIVDEFTLEDRRIPLRLNRIQPGENAERVWVFSRQSVENIPDLFALYGPTQLEQDLPDWARERSLFGLYVWELVFIPLLLIATAIITAFAYRTFGELGRTGPGSVVRLVARSLKWPMTIALAAGLIGLATSEVFIVTGIIDAFLGPVVVIAYVLAGTLAVVFIIDEIFNRINKSNPNELADPDNAHLRSMATTIAAARKFVIVIAVLVGTGVVLSSIDSLSTVGFSFLASAGALTVILGFAAREVLGNILASVQIALNRSARIGDQLTFEGHFCTVESIHFTYVQLLMWNGTRFIVPVSYFVSDAFENWSIEDPKMVRPIKMTLAQEADMDALRQAFFDLVDKEDADAVAPRDRIKVNVTGQDAFGIEVRFELPTADPATGWEIECRVREGLIEAAQRLQQERGRMMLPEARAIDEEG